MKCPLLQVAWMVNNKTESHEVFDCLKEECAWWDKTAENCVVLQLAFELDEVHCWLEKLADKMPHEEQFKR